MITCSYCGTPTYVMEEGPYKDHAHCSFCQVTLGPNSEYGMYAMNGERFQRNRIENESDYEEMLSDPLPVLMEYHTADLLRLLKHAKGVRSSQYNLLRIMNRGAEEGSSELGEAADYQGKEYEVWTRYCWRIENILVQRIGYFPKKLTDDFIMKFEERCKNSSRKPMLINKEKQ